VSSRIATVVHALFYRRSASLVVGLALADGRRVVLKLHRWRVSIERVAAVQAVQTYLVQAPHPHPPAPTRTHPLLPPKALGAGVVTVEDLLPAGYADGHRPAIRRALASGLASFMAAAAPLRERLEIGRAAILEPLPGSPYPEPHDLRFDFEGTATGAQWIDELAWEARDGLEQEDDVAVGHVDWRVGNLGFVDKRLAATYDWDSVGIAPEAVIVGAASAHFCADWARGRELASPREMRLFLGDYERSRGRPFDEGEWSVIDAANLLQCAYGARCQHSDAVLGVEDGANREEGWTGLLRRRGQVSLRS
jgi:hypothetical protein